MKRASVTEAKNQLSALLDRVKAGEEVTILERGTPIARIVPFGQPSSQRESAALQADLERRGLIAPASRPRVASTSFPRVRLPKGRTLVEALLEEREEGR